MVVNLKRWLFTFQVKSFGNIRGPQLLSCTGRIVQEVMLRRTLTTFAKGDVVMLRSVVRSDRVWLSEPLKEDGRTNINQGVVSHNDIMGLKSRSLVKSSQSNSYIVTHASTEDYITMSKRAATPIYPLDASAIVSLADLHVDFPQLNPDGQTESPPLQFFEAGTGHGSLTLAICSKIHSANCYYKTHGVKGAILHSIDRNEAHSNVGTKTIKNFRRGMYLDDVTFHIADSPESWLQGAHEWRNLENNVNEAHYDGFLSGAFLDLPDISPNISPIVQELKQDAPLIVFCPSVTQIMDVLKTIKDNEGQIKLTHIKTIQLMPGMGGGLQEWDTRYTMIRATGEEGVVCRPRAGSRLVGGGFVGVFKKLPRNAVLKKFEKAEST